MKHRLFLSCFTAILCVLNTNLSAKQFSSGGMYQELQPRSGIPSFIQKLGTADTLRIAYLGGSITEAPGWRVYSFEWFKEKFPNLHFEEIAAAIGGTGSEFGACRLGEQVISKNPDLVFVEFAVNDNGRLEDKIIQAMEGIVRQIKISNPETDICFVYTIQENFLKQEREGGVASIKSMETVADHYGIPSINFGIEVSKRVQEETLIFTGSQPFLEDVMVFSNDRVHPYLETGQKIYFEIFKRSFEKLLGSTSDLSRELPHPLHSDPLVNTSTYPVEEIFLEGDWEEVLPSRQPGWEKFASFYDKIYVASDESASLHLKFKGTAVGFADILGQDSGVIMIELDGKEQKKVIRFDAYSNFRRMSYYLINDLEEKEHDLLIRWHPEKIDKASILKNRNIEINKSVDYQSQKWYLGKILVNGTIIR